MHLRLVFLGLLAALAYAALALPAPWANPPRADITGPDQPPVDLPERVLTSIPPKGVIVSGSHRKISKRFPRHASNGSRRRQLRLGPSKPSGLTPSAPVAALARRETSDESLQKNRGACVLLSAIGVPMAVLSVAGSVVLKGFIRTYGSLAKFRTAARMQRAKYKTVERPVNGQRMKFGIESRYSDPKGFRNELLAAYGVTGAAAAGATFSCSQWATHSKEKN